MGAVSLNTADLIEGRITEMVSRECKTGNHDFCADIYCMCECHDGPLTTDERNQREIEEFQAADALRFTSLKSQEEMP